MVRPFPAVVLVVVCTRAIDHSSRIVGTVVAKQWARRVRLLMLPAQHRRAASRTTLTIVTTERLEVWIRKVWGTALQSVCDPASRALPRGQTWDILWLLMIKALTFWCTVQHWTAQGLSKYLYDQAAL